MALRSHLRLALLLVAGAAIRSRYAGGNRSLSPAGRDANYASRPAGFGRGSAEVPVPLTPDTWHLTPFLRGVL